MISTSGVTHARWTELHGGHRQAESFAWVAVEMDVVVDVVVVVDVDVDVAD